MKLLKQSDYDKYSTEDLAHKYFESYIAVQYPTYRFSPHNYLISDKLRQLEKGVIRRLMILMPPRHGKTMQVSEFFPAWYLGRNPTHQVIAATYSYDRAGDIGRKVRNQLVDPLHNMIFPNCTISQDSKGANKLALNQGGHYFSVGVGGAIVGRGANLFIIDDPVKPLAIDTPIPTPSGWKLMGELQIGDQVFDHSGKPCNVINVTERYTAPRHRVKFSDKSYIDTHPDHLWRSFDRQSHDVFTNGTMENGKMHKRTFYDSKWWNWKTLGKSSIKEVSTKKISKTLVARKTMRNWTIPVTFPLQLPEIELPIDPYILGYWLGDGSKRDPCFTMNEQDMPNFLKQVDRSGYFVLSKRCKKGTNNYTVSVSTINKRGNKWHDTLIGRIRKLGLLNNKHVPKIYLRASYNQRLALLRGLMDSDGGIEPDHGETVFCSTDKPIADGVYELIVSLGGKVVVATRPAANKTAYILRGFYPFQPFNLPRKMTNYKPNGQIRRVNRTIIDVEILEPTEHMCITVDSDSHLFLAGRAMIPTCNSREDAESITSRKKITEWFKAVAYTRLMPDNRIVIIMTRWHFDDLVGRLLEEAKEKWDVLSLPAIAEHDDELTERKTGEALWSSDYPLETLGQIKTSIGSREWNAQYQQKPFNEEGGMIQLSWFKRYDLREVTKYDISARIRHKNDEDKPFGIYKIILSWDTAFKEAEMNDPSSCTAWGISKLGYYLLYVFNKRVGFPALKRTAIKLWERYMAYNMGAVAVLIEDRASGQSLIQVLESETRIPIIPIKPESNKVIRMDEISPIIEAGHVHLPDDASWLIRYETQMAQFPLGREDDDVDSTTQFLRWISKPRYKRSTLTKFWK